MITEAQSRVIEQHGTPLPFVDDLTSNTYILLKVEFVSNLGEGGFTARIPGIQAYGEGDTEQEASLALCEALRGYMNAFGNDRPM